MLETIIVAIFDYQFLTKKKNAFRQTEKNPVGNVIFPARMASWLPLHTVMSSFFFMDFFKHFFLFFSSSSLIAHDIILCARLFDCFVIVIILHSALCGGPWTWVLDLQLVLFTLKILTGSPQSRALPLRGYPVYFICYTYYINKLNLN